MHVLAIVHEPTKSHILITEVNSKYYLRKVPKDYEGSKMVKILEIKAKYEKRMKDYTAYACKAICESIIDKITESSRVGTIKKESFPLGDYLTEKDIIWERGIDI